MKAIVYTEYGPPEVLHLQDIDRPVPKGHQVLVQVRAASANALDWHYLHGTPYIARLDFGVRRPKNPRLGVDLAGVVVEVGPEVTRFKVGDEVFGTGPGSFAEYTLANEQRLAMKQSSISFEDAAAVPVAALTALQGLRDIGGLKAGQKVLINGASGGVGTYAVQIAKALGAEVTGVCSDRNVELVRTLGADHVVDYKREDFTLLPERYDLIVDNVGTRPSGEIRRALTPTGTLVVVGGGGLEDSVWGFSFVGSLAKRWVMKPFIDQKVLGFMSEIKHADLEYIQGLMVEGKVHSVIDRRYRLAQVPDAIRYLEAGHARGKVVIDVD